MALFAAGALAYFFGVALGWRPWSFKAFYLLGGVLTVPVLALGTVYLLIGRRWGDRVALAAGAGRGVRQRGDRRAPLRRPLSPDRLDAGREVLGLGPRILAAVGSGWAPPWSSSGRCGARGAVAASGAGRGPAGDDRGRPGWRSPTC